MVEGATLCPIDDRREKSLGGVFYIPYYSIGYTCRTMKGEQLPRDVRRAKAELSRGWEDVSNEASSEAFFKLIEQDFKRYGLDIETANVLEVGSGNGAFLDYLLKKKVNAVGVDARPRGAPGLPQAAARIEQLPFKDAVFDAVVSSQVFDHSVYEQDFARMMSEISRVLRTGGIYIGNTERIPLPEAPYPGLELVSDPKERFWYVIFKKT